MKLRILAIFKPYLGTTWLSENRFICLWKYEVKDLRYPVISQHHLFEQFSYRPQLFHWWGGLSSSQGGFMQVIGLRGSWKQLEAVLAKIYKATVKINELYLSVTSKLSLLHSPFKQPPLFQPHLNQVVLHHFHTPQCLVCYYTWLCTVRDWFRNDKLAHDKFMVTLVQERAPSDNLRRYNSNCLRCVQSVFVLSRSITASEAPKAVLTMHLFHAEMV